MRIKISSNIISGILRYIILTIGCILIAYGSYNKGFSNGADKMFYAVTDTIQEIITKQINNTTHVTKLTFESRDTTSYILSTKTILND